jgi:UDP-glucuronate 4-epimerase
LDKVIITGSAGFIGFHLSKLLLSEGYNVLGIDNYDNYYDLKLKRDRTKILLSNDNYSHEELDITTANFIQRCLRYKPKIIIHLAAQAGVRYSITNPVPYINTNLVGTFNVLELARALNLKHLLMASTSSVYGANTTIPFSESQKCDTQLSLYAATKKSNEVIAHSYSHLFDIPTTMFRFFTVYGPWGRPDMALFKFTKAIMSEESIDIYNNGDMTRDFTYVEDLVFSIMKLINVPPDNALGPVTNTDSLSPVAPWRAVNIGSSKSIPLMDYVIALENALGKSAKKNFLEMQAGDVKDTLSDVTLLNALIGDTRKTPVDMGVKKFVDWYMDYHSKDI